MSEISAILDFPPSERARQMSNLASVLNLQNGPREAPHLLIGAERILHDHASHDPIQYAVLYGNRAMSQQLQNQLDKAEHNYLKALDLVETNIGLSNVFAASDKAGLGYICTHRGRYKEAKHYYEEALTIFRERGGSDRPVVRRTEAEYAILKQKIEEQNSQ